MMKYPSIFKFIIVLVVAMGLHIVPAFSAKTANISSEIHAALVSFPSNWIQNRAQLAAENQLFRRLLSQSYALNILYELELNKASKSQTVKLDDSSNNQNDTIENNVLHDGKFGLVAESKINSTPVLYFNNPTFYLESITVQSDTSEKFVSGWSFLLGIYNAKTSALVPFNPENSQLTARINKGVQIPIEVINLFTYRIKLPAGITPPTGLVELNSGLLLGVKINEYQEADTIFAEYQLPFQLQINDPVRIIKPQVVNKNTEQTDL